MHEFQRNAAFPFSVYNTVAPSYMKFMPLMVFLQLKSPDREFLRIDLLFPNFFE